MSQNKCRDFSSFDPFPLHGRIRVVHWTARKGRCCLLVPSNTAAPMSHKRSFSNILNLQFTYTLALVISTKMVLRNSRLCSSQLLGISIWEKCKFPEKTGVKLAPGGFSKISCLNKLGNGRMATCGILLQSVSLRGPSLLSRTVAVRYHPFSLVINASFVVN